MAHTPRRDSWSFGKPYRPLYMRPRLRRLASIVAMTLSLAMITSSSFAAVYTDKYDYDYGETVQITGDEMAAGEDVSVDISYPDGSLAQNHFVTADEAGNFLDSFYLENGLPGGIYLVTATGLSSGNVFTVEFDPAVATLSTSSIAFGNVNVGSQSAATTVTITNTGNTNMNVTAIALSGANTNQFVLDTTGALTNGILPLASVSFTVRFAPTSTGAKSATVDVSTNGNDPTVTLSGTGVASDLTAPTVTIASASGSAGTDNSSPFDVTTNSNPTITWSADESGTYAVKTGTCAAGTTLTGTNTSGSYTTGSVTSTINLSGLTEGANTVRVCVTDNATNTGSDSADVLKDTVAPTVTVTPARVADLNGWYNAPVVFDTSGTDATSGVLDANCSANHNYTGPDGTGLTRNGSCTDNAGNVGNGTSAVFKFDDTDPTVTVTPARVADLNGWYNAPVVFDTSGTDATSGVLDANCSANHNYTGPDGTGLTRNGSCTDNAGNVGNGTSAVFKFDDTDPTVTVTPARVADLNGWYNAPVVFDTSGTDATSGVLDANCSANHNYTGPDGTGLTRNGSCTDNAGNVGNGTSAVFKFDDTDPTVTVTPARVADLNGWYNAPVVFDTSGTDATSGVLDANCSANHNYTGPDGTGLTRNGSCTDNAGNVGNGTSAVFKFDDTDPTVTVTPARVADLNGWYNAPVVFDTSGTDATSGVLDANCSANHNYTGPDGTGLTRNGSCTDNAGNVGNGTSAVFKFDDTDPTISIVTPLAGAAYALNQPVAASYSCTDTTSGPPSCVGTEANGVNIDTSSVGAKSFTVNAEDQAGNTATQTNGYTVSYVFSGFFQPVDNYAVNSAKAGQAVPVKWRLTDHSGAGVSDPASFKSVMSSAGASACGGQPTDAIEEYAGSSGLQYLGDGYWQFNWKTPKSYVGQCRTMKLYLNDGTATGAVYKTASFQFK